MIFADLIRRYGDNDAAIASRLGVSRQLVGHWRKKGISEARQVWIQHISKGRLRATLKARP